MAGVVEGVERMQGRFLAAFRDEAPDLNERATLLVSDGELQLRCTLIAGLIARRIVLWIAPGRRLGRGERIGLIQFGSRVDLSLPPGFEPAVRIGQKVIAGVTVVARLKGSQNPGD
jgi:phosphatidylserine decarboxylase